VLRIEESRLKHSVEVARKAQRLALARKLFDLNYAGEMFTLGWLHDMGYEFSEVASDHPERGGVILKQQGYKNWREIYYHSNPESPYQSPYQSPELDILNTADMLTGPNGEYLTAEVRLKDISERYGIKSNQYVNAEKICRQLDLI